MPFRVAKQIFFGSGFSAGAWICWPVASAGIEHEGVAVFESDFDRPAGRGALIEPIGLFRFVIVGNPLPDGLPGRNDGIEGLDVEGRVGRWRMPMTSSQRPWRRRKNSISPERKKLLAPGERFAG